MAARPRYSPEQNIDRDHYCVLSQEAEEWIGHTQERPRRSCTESSIGPQEPVTLDRKWVLKRGEPVREPWLRVREPWRTVVRLLT